MGYLRSQSVRLSLWKLRYLSLDPLFFSQVKADLCNKLHSLIIIFFFFGKGRFFGGGWYQRKGGEGGCWSDSDGMSMFRQKDVPMLYFR